MLTLTGIADSPAKAQRNYDLEKNIPHTPGDFRRYVVRNLDVRCNAVGAKPGEKFYLPPADRIKIW